MNSGKPASSRNMPAAASLLGGTGDAKSSRPAGTCPRGASACGSWMGRTGSPSTATSAFAPKSRSRAATAVGPQTIAEAPTPSKKHNDRFHEHKQDKQGQGQQAGRRDKRQRLARETPGRHTPSLSALPPSHAAQPGAAVELPSPRRHATVANRRNVEPCLRR